MDIANTLTFRGLAGWSLDGEDYAGLHWDAVVAGRSKPTLQELATWDTERKAILVSFAYRAQRAFAYRDEMGVERGDFLKTIGDVLDVVLGQIEFSGIALTPEMTTLLQKRTTIKTRIPKT